MSAERFQLAAGTTTQVPDARWQLAPDLHKAVAAMDRLLRLALDWQLQGVADRSAAAAPLGELTRRLFVSGGEKQRLLLRLQERLPLNRGYLAQTRPDLMDMAASMLLRHRPSGRMKAPLSAYRLALTLAAGAPELQADLCSLVDRCLRRATLVPVRSSDARFSTNAMAWALHSYLANLDAKSLLVLHREVQAPLLAEDGWGAGFDLLLLAAVARRPATIPLPQPLMLRLLALPDLAGLDGFQALRRHCEAAVPEGARVPQFLPDMRAAPRLPDWLQPLLARPDGLAQLFPGVFTLPTPASVPRTARSVPPQPPGTPPALPGRLTPPPLPAKERP